jgi:uncharacterized protein YvpB
MQKINLIITVVFLLALSIAAKGQTAASDYFAGKWNVLVKNLPQGDTKMIVNLENQDTTWAGNIADSTGKEISKFSKVELQDSSVTVYFTAQGYDVYLRLEQKDEDHVTGSMLDMFDAQGERIKE